MRRTRAKKALLALAVLAAATVAVIAATGVSGAKSRETPEAVAGAPLANGCLICHGESSKWEKGSDLYVAPAAFGSSKHASLECTSCHVDFTSQPQPVAETDARRVAGLACKTCHASEFTGYALSIHGEKALASDEAAPTCAGCHGSHEITDASELRADRVCADCHSDRYATYADYYHGRPYKLGANDAPACWDCHSNHSVQPASAEGSFVASDRLPETCGQCHEDTSESFTQFAKLIHGREQAQKDNVVVKFVNGVVDALTSLLP